MRMNWERVVLGDRPRWQRFITDRILVEPSTGCWRWQRDAGAKSGQYLTCIYLGAYRNTTVTIRRLAFRVFNPFKKLGFVCPCPHDTQATRPCCNPAHLKHVPSWLKR